MAGEYLPPVVTELTANIDDVLAKVEEAKAAIQSIGDVKVPVGFDIDDASLAKVKTQAQSLADTVGRIQLPVDTDLNAASLLATAAATKALTGAFNQLTSGTDNASNSMRILGTGIRVNSLAFHVLLASAIDFAAVAGPALVAAGAWAADWMQGVGNVYQHMTALYDATESLGQAAGKTFGNELGLKDALQAAQNAANPQVYQALGGAINLVKEQFGDLAKTGLQVGSIFDTFMAHLDVDFSNTGDAGKTMNGLLQGMVPDLVGLGQVIGNVGHAVGELANDMPGFAHVLLNVVDIATQGVTSFLNLGAASHALVLGFFALHEFNTWGSAAVTMMGKLGLYSYDLQGSFMGFTRAGAVLTNFVRAPLMLLSNASMGLGNVMTGLGVEVGETGAGFENFGASVKAAALSIGPLQAAILGLGAVALGFIIDKIVTAQNTTQKFISTLQSGISGANNLSALNDITAGISSLATQMAKVSQTAVSESGPWSLKFHSQMLQAATDTRLLTGEQQSLNNQFTGIISHATQAGNVVGTTMAGGMALATAAGVNLDKTLSSSAWVTALQQIRNYVAGMKAMGSSTGQVGADMSALAIQEGLNSSQLSKINSAWDSFMQNLTAGTGDLASAVTSLSNIGQVVGTVKNNLGEASSISLTTRQFAQALNTAGTTGAQAWTNFDQVLGSTYPQLTDWLRTAQTEGAITGTSFSHDILDMAASLVPFAEKSKAAQAEVMGLAQEAGIQGLTFQQLVSDYKSGKFSLDDLTSSVDQATIKMANMNAVAQQLGNVVQTDFINEVGQAIVSSGKMTGQINNLIKAAEQFGANSPDVTKALGNIRSMLEQAGIHGQELKSILQGLQQYINTMHGKTIDMYVNTIGGVAPGNASSTGGVGHPVQYASGTSGAAPGWALVGERGPELMWMRGGETVIPNHRLNGYADGAGVIETHNHVYLDGKQIYESVKRQSFNDNFRNGNRKSGGRPKGVMAPR